MALDVQQSHAQKRRTDRKNKQRSAHVQGALLQYERDLLQRELDAAREREQAALERERSARDCEALLLRMLHEAQQQSQRLLGVPRGLGAGGSQPVQRGQRSLTAAPDTWQRIIGYMREHPGPKRPVEIQEALALQRHFSALTKFAHGESRVCGRKRQGKVVFYAFVNLCVKKHVRISVAVGLGMASTPRYVMNRMVERGVLRRLEPGVYVINDEGKDA